MRTKDITLEIGISAFLFLSIFLFWKNNLLLTAVFVITISLLLVKNKRIKEAYFALLGLVLGFLIEILAQPIGFESYANPTFLGVPLWMPFMWSYAFIVIYRIGKVMVEK